MPIIIDSAVSGLPERIGRELSCEIASGRRGGPLADAVLPLNAALLSRAAKIDALNRQLADRDATIQSQGAEIERLREVAKKAQMLCTWIAESPHRAGSINGLAAQTLHLISAALTRTKG